MDKNQLISKREWYDGIGDPELDDFCFLVRDFCDYDEMGFKTDEYLRMFDFKSEAEIRNAAWMIMDRCANDPYLMKNIKNPDIVTPRYAAVHARFMKIDRNLQSHDSFPSSTAKDLWCGGYGREKMLAKANELFATKPDASKFAQATEAIQRVYNLSADDMEKLHFFVEQVKAGDNFPNSLRRMLYIWGDKKKTGKTTFASCMVEILNGYTGEYKGAEGFITTLSQELQIGSFEVPLITVCNACLMDECFYADMGKTYASFKAHLTSSSGKARSPYRDFYSWHGNPNYIATSNDRIQKFIKDFNDRRYLVIEFKDAPTVKTSDFGAIKDLAMMYAVNSTRTKDWMQWAEEIAQIADEDGEYQINTDEFELELKQTHLCSRILEKADFADGTPNNYVSLKFFVDLFRETMGAEASKHRNEIEKAVLAAYGARYSTTRNWRVSDIKERAQYYLSVNRGFVPTEKNNNDQAPF